MNFVYEEKKMKSKNQNIYPLTIGLESWEWIKFVSFLNT